jgi:peptidoglycan/LPS O-acetylase OafA/YrhL
MYTYGFTCLYLGYGCLLVGFLHVPLNDIGRPILMGLRVIAYIGTFSYSIYLWHLFGMHLVQHLPLGQLVRLALYYGAAILLGIVTAKLIEFPALRLRDHLFPPSAPQALEPVLASSAANREL